MIDGRVIIARILIRGLMEGNKLGGRVEEEGEYKNVKGLQLLWTDTRQ